MSYYYDDEFYTQPSEFDEEIESFKESLSKSIQKKFLDEMEELREENISLREFRDNKERYERELKAAKAEYQRKMQDAERQANQKKAQRPLKHVCGCWISGKTGIQKKVRSAANVMTTEKSILFLRWGEKWKKIVVAQKVPALTRPKRYVCSSFMREKKLLIHILSRLAKTAIP